MHRDPHCLVPDQGASADELRAACLQLAAVAQRATLQRDEAEMALRRILYRHKNGRQAISSTEWVAIELLASRNASPLRAHLNTASSSTAAETLLHSAVGEAVGMLNGARPADPTMRAAHQLLKDVMVQVDQLGLDPGLSL